MKRLLVLLLLISTPLWGDTTAGGTFGYGSAAGGGLTCTDGSGDSAIVSHTGYSTGPSTSVSLNHWRGGSIVLSASTRITSVTLYMENIIGGAYNATLEIYSTSGSPALPTSIANANATKTMSIPASSAQTRKFVFDTPFTLAAGTYGVVLKGANADDNLGMGIYYDSEAGHFFWTNDGSSWNEDTGVNPYIVVNGCQ